MKLDRDVYNTKLGDETVIRVNHTEGSNVTFDWKLGDQFDVISDAGSYHAAFNIFTKLLLRLWHNSFRRRSKIALGISAPYMDSPLYRYIMFYENCKLFVQE